MNHVVAKPFNTPFRRFKAGDPVAEPDLEGDALGFPARKEKGFVAERAPANPSAKPAVQAGAAVRLSA